MNCLQLFLLVVVFFSWNFLAESASRLVTTTPELYAALSDPEVDTVLLDNTLIINPADWPATLSLGRSILISATPERLTNTVYVLLDFNNTVMMFEVQPGYTVKFMGLEMFQHYDAVGPTIRPVRMSVNAYIGIENCVTRRRAGLPYAAALVNMLNATRPSDMPGRQNCTMTSNYTYKSTRSASPITVPNAVSQYDYAMTLPQDSSLAYQGLYYGGYTYVARQSVYIVDNAVSFECMKERPGTECVTLLLQQLDGQKNAPPPPDDDDVGGSGSGNTATIVIAVVVPCAVVLLAVAATVLFVRHRGRKRLSYTKAAQASSDVEGGGKGRTPSSLAAGHDSGCVFLGLEENQQLPEWSPLAADVDEEDEDHDEDGTGHKPHQTDTSRLGGDAEGQRVGGLDHRAKRALPVSNSDGISGACGSGLLRPALSTQVRDDGGGGGNGDVGGDGKDNGNDTGGKAGAGPPEAAAAAAAAGAAGPASSSAASHSQGAGPDMLAELGRMAQELRANVKDEAIKLEAVIGSGSFGTVYRGTWQGLPVAVKTLVFSASDESRRRALQEAALCASISHPNVVATYSSELQPLGALGSGPVSGSSPNTSSGATKERELPQILEWRLYIVQEFADGGPLRKLYGNKSLWPAPGVVHLPAVVGLALGIARALAHLHVKRIIHGDLNPNNVLLKRDPGEPSGYAIKVGDFGLSVMLPHNRTHLSNLRMGTMFYMCPAVVMKGQVGPSSDVFSLGVMLWELYHGRRAGIRTDQGPRYSSVFPAFPPSCPEPYRAVALHCLQRQPQNRPSAAVVEAHLEQLLNSLCAANAASAAAAAAVAAAAAAMTAPVAAGPTAVPGAAVAAAAVPGAAVAAAVPGAAVAAAAVPGAACGAATPAAAVAAGAAAAAALEGGRIS